MTFFVLCPPHRSGLPPLHCHMKISGLLERYSRYRYTCGHWMSSVTLPAQLPTDPSQSRSTQLSLPASRPPGDSCVPFSFKLAFFFFFKRRGTQYAIGACRISTESESSGYRNHYWSFLRKPTVRVAVSRDNLPIIVYFQIQCGCVSSIKK